MSPTMNRWIFTISIEIYFISFKASVFKLHSTDSNIFWEGKILGSGTSPKYQTNVFLWYLTDLDLKLVAVPNILTHNPFSPIKCDQDIFASIFVTVFIVKGVCIELQKSFPTILMIGYTSSLFSDSFQNN